MESGWVWLSVTMRYRVGGCVGKKQQFLALRNYAMAPEALNKQTKYTIC